MVLRSAKSFLVLNRVSVSDALTVASIYLINNHGRKLVSLKINYRKKAPLTQEVYFYISLATHTTFLYCYEHNPATPMANMIVKIESIFSTIIMMERECRKIWKLLADQETHFEK